MSSRRIAFVTGATGFVGSHLVDRLTGDGWSVRALARSTSDTRHLQESGAEVIPGDLSDRDALARGIAGTDAVFHLAAVTAARTEQEYLAANVEGTAAVVASVRASEPKQPVLVYLSSYAAGGPAYASRSRACGDPPLPLTAYGRTKLAGEVAARAAEADGVRVVIIRAPAVYGPGGADLLPFFRLIRWRLAPVPGGEDRRLHLIFAPDLALALSRAVEAPPGTYAVAEPTEHRWSAVVRTIADVMERSAIRLPLPPLLVRTVAAATETAGRLVGRAVPFNREKAEEMLASAWTCDLSGSEVLLRSEEATPLREGIAETVRWYHRQGWL
jgi:dihydroflavonol-4-reductase